MLLSRLFIRKLGINMRCEFDGSCNLQNSSCRREQFLVLAIYVVSVFLILSTSRTVIGDEIIAQGIHANVSASLPVENADDCKCPEVIPGLISDGSQSELSQVFEVSTRHLSDRFRSINFDQPNVEVNKWAGNRWLRSNVEDALPSGGTGLLTIIYVHGNFMERNNALERLQIVDRYLREQADRPYRLLMLSWPSQLEKKPLRDALSNAESAECQSLYLAWMLQRFRNEPHVSVLGFSFGARTVTGGLHLDAGGVIPGFASTPSTNIGTSQKYRVGLVAPALDRNWIERNGRHQLALSHVDSLVNLYNSRDPILRRFRFLDRLSRPIAAGFSGFIGVATRVDPRATTPLTGQSRIRQYDCGSIIGTTHSEKSYYSECPYFRSMIQHLLWKDSVESTCNASVVPK